MKVPFVDANASESKNGEVFCYRSSLAVFEEGLFKGVPVSYGYNTAGYPLNVLSNFPSRLDPHAFSEPFCFNVQINGESICRKMTFCGFEKTEENGILHTTAAFRSGVKPIRIYEHTLLDSTSMMTRYLEIENLSSEPVSISRLVLHGGGIETLDLNDVSWLSTQNFKNIYSYGCFDNDEWGREGEFAFHPLMPGTFTLNCGFGSSRFRHPALFLFNKLTGDTYFVQVGWCGGVRFNVSLDAKESCSKVNLSYSAEITGHNPLISLAPGEKFTTPMLHFCAVHGFLDDAVNENIAHLRKSVLNSRYADGSLLFVGSGMGAEHDMSVETSLSFANQMHDMGGEVFIVDAGWSCPPGKETSWFDYNGINKPDAERYPDSIAEIRDFCHGMGMKFGLWMEPERMGKMCEARSTHPEWFARDIYGDICEGFIDMTNPDAVHFVEHEIARVITNYKLDLLRIDYNVSGVEAFSFSDNGSGIEECSSLRHYSAVYEMFERLKKRFPAVIFENCAGGGGRTDTGMMRNFNHTWVSDNQIMPRSVEITNGMTMVLPPERVDRLFAGMGCHKKGELYAHMRNTMLTHMSLNVIAPTSLVPNSEAMEFIIHSVDFYKRNIRPILPESRVYHLTPDRASAKELGCRALQITSAAGDVTVIAAFSGSEAEKKNIRIFPEAVDAGAEYSVYTDNCRTEYYDSGKNIISDGVVIKLGSSLSSELIMLKKIKE